MDPDIERLCSLDGAGGLYECPADRTCGHPQMYNIPLSKENITDSSLIFYGVVTFDNLGRSILSIFQVLTLEGWTAMMYNVKCDF
jgi:hypothetical protein